MVSNRRLSTQFYAEMDKFMACYKKEFADQKKNGNVDEREADAISSTLFKLVAATEYLKSTVSYIWKKAKDEGQLSKYSIGTWSRKVARSEIMKWGTEEDKAKLPPSMTYNKADSRKRGGWNVQTNRVRQVAANKRRRVAIVEDDRVQQEFSDAFGGLHGHGNNDVDFRGVEASGTVDVGS